MSARETYSKRERGLASTARWLKLKLDEISCRYSDELSDDLKVLPNFEEILDIQKASLKIIEAIRQNKKIGLYGDYDADGSTSLALFYTFLTKNLNYAHINVYQPNRMTDGYGLHLSSIENALKDGVELLITFDCGITNHESAEYAKTSGLELIITDHHNSGEREIPVAYAVVNPNRKDQPESDTKKLAGVGVSFALAKIIRDNIGSHIPSVYPLLQYFCIGTIGDMVHLNHMNKKLVRHGLKQWRNSNIPAVQALVKKFDPYVIDSEFIGFKVAPIINAKGRLDAPDLALKFLVSETLQEAESILDSLIMTNEDRKKIQNSGVIIAHNKIKKPENSDSKIYVLYNKSFHVGIVGLVASMITNEYERPAIVLGNDPKREGVLKGSVRSVGDFDIFSFLQTLDFPFVSFGGHKKAAGLAIKEEDLEKFINKIKEASENIHYKKNEEVTIKALPSEISIDVANALALYGPFGEGNIKPKFSTRLTIKEVKILKDKHLKIQVEEISTPFLYFNYINPSRSAPDWSGKNVEIVYDVRIGEFNNSIKLELFVKSVNE